MTLNEISFNILNKMRGGRSSNNEYISLDQIKFNINYYRSLILHRDLRRSQNKHLFEQSLNVQLESDNPFDFKITNIPQIIQLEHEYPIYIRNSSDSYPIENYHRSNFMLFNSWTNNKPRFFIKGNTILISVSANTFNQGDTFTITGIFENPTQVYLRNGFTVFNADDQPYPASGDLIQRISQSLINGDLELILRTANDITADNLSPNPKGQ